MTQKTSLPVLIEARMSLLVVGVLFATALSAQLTTESLAVDGQMRTYLQYIPVDFEAAEEVPLVLCFHAGAGVAEDQLAIGIAGYRRRRALYSRLPPGPARPNDGGSTNWQVVTSGDLPTFPNPHSDIDFVAALIDEMHASRCGPHPFTQWGIQWRRICVRPGRRLNDQITGAGAVARTMYAESYANCETTHPTPVVTILGTIDFNPNYDGVVYNGTLYYHSSDEGNALWIDENELLPDADIVELPDPNTSDGSTVNATNGPMPMGAES